MENDNLQYILDRLANNGWAIFSLGNLENVINFVQEDFLYKYWIDKKRVHFEIIEAIE